MKYVVSFPSQKKALSPKFSLVVLVQLFSSSKFCLIVDWQKRIPADGHLLSELQTIQLSWLEVQSLW